MDKNVLNSQIIEILSNSELECMSTKQIYDKLKSEYGCNISYNRVRHRLQSFEDYREVESEM